MSNKISVKEYFAKGIFVIPDYQRGYKWSVKENNEESSTEFFIKSLLKAYNDKLKEYFIEAVTVVEDDGKIILVDGQQRTTTLFLLFSILDKGYFSAGKIQYDVRNDSHQWLSNLSKCCKAEIEDEDTQDIFYFKNAIQQIQNKINEVDKEDFVNFLEGNIYLLYNQIPKDKAINIFISLNGLKAIMKEEELIKSDLLIKSSRVVVRKTYNENEQFGIEWKINEDRGRLARNWDKWIYWWNQGEVRKYFGISTSQHPLYYLLVTYWNINNNSEVNKNFSFDNFKNKFSDSIKNAKHNFEGLRKLQKTFEDLFNDNESHNFLGLILKTSSSKESALQYFLSSEHRNKDLLEDYAKWSLVGATHLEIINNTIEIKTDENNFITDLIIKERKAFEAISLVSEKYVYWDEKDADFTDQRKEYAFRFLFLLNLLEDNKLNRKFNFAIWDNRSLEHIYPKSKMSALNFETTEYIEGSVHCLGNLVLLYGRDNSSFGAKDFQDKKSAYFNTSEKFQSRNLLHTISIFAKSDWKEREIIKNKTETIKQLNGYYGI